jgi:putative aldouronate transport system permease protein
MVMRKSRATLADVVIYIVTGLIAIVALYPFVYVISMSLSGSSHILAKDVYLFPKDFSLDSYVALFHNAKVIRALGNSVWYTVVGTLVSSTLTLTAAYVLSRPQFFLRRFLSQFMVITMFISGGLIPLYVVVTQLGLYNSRWSIILPYAISTFNLIVARTFFSGISESVHEAAKLDGANDWSIFVRVILPLSKPIIAVMVLFYAVGYWNSYFAPLIFLSDDSLHPLQLYLRQLLLTSQAGGAGLAGGADAAVLAEQLKYAVIVISVIPIAALYPFVQKYFKQGVMIGSVRE